MTGISVGGQSSEGGGGYLKRPRTNRRGGSFSSVGEDDDEETGSVVSTTLSGAAEADDGGAPKGVGRGRYGLRLSCGRDLLQLQQQQQQLQPLALRPKPAGAATSASELWRTTLTGVLSVARVGRLSEQLGGFVRLATSAASSGPGIPTVIAAAHPRFVAVGTSKGVVVLFDAVRGRRASMRM